LALDESALQALMVASQAGEARAHRVLLAALAPRLRAFFRAKGTSVEDSEDLVQETLIAIHTKRHLYDPGQPLLGWTYAVARHRLIDRWRKAGRRGLHVALEDHEPFLAADLPEAGDPSRDVARLLATLPHKQRRAIELVKLGEASIQQASEQTGWTPSDIKVSIHRGLKTLMARMADPATAAPGDAP
jgi:RNA polymerase sigma-70 factor, ECF subfamily